MLWQMLGQFKKLVMRQFAIFNQEQSGMVAGLDRKPCNLFIRQWEIKLFTPVLKQIFRKVTH
jgi:hypothetical protein